MISDVLFQAIRDIEDYQRDFHHYDDLRDEIDRVTDAMRSLQRRLDDAPPDWATFAPNAATARSS